VKNKEDWNFIMMLFEKLETETQNVIGNRPISKLPVEIIKEVPNQSGFHTKFTVPCDGPGAYENFSKIKNQRYLLVQVLNKFLFPHGINTKETVVYRGYVPPNEATRSIKEGNMYCDEGGYIDPHFIPHGMCSHLLQTYFLAALFSKEGVASFSFRDFLSYIGSTGRYWVPLMDNVMVPPPRKNRMEIFTNLMKFSDHDGRGKDLFSLKNGTDNFTSAYFLKSFLLSPEDQERFPSLLGSTGHVEFPDHYGRGEDLFSLKNGTDNFTNAYFLTSFLLSPEAQERFPSLHRMVCLDCLSLVDSYRERFNQHPEVTEKFARDILYKGPLEFPLTFRNAFNLLETMLIKHGPPTPEKYGSVYKEYKKHFTEEPGIKTLPREFANPSEEEIDAWFPGENVSNRNTHLVNQTHAGGFFQSYSKRNSTINKVFAIDSAQKDLKKHSKENCSASTYFFSKPALLHSQSVTTAKEKVGQYDNKQLLYQR
jgi:hypothetical protein